MNANHDRLLVLREIRRGAVKVRVLLVFPGMQSTTDKSTDHGAVHRQSLHNHARFSAIDPSGDSEEKHGSYLHQQVW